MRVQRASTFLSRGTTPTATAPPAVSFGLPMLPMSHSSASDATNFVQLQLSLRNLKRNDSLSPTDPLAIISCAADTPQSGVFCWSELGRTECKASSINPNFHQKVIVCLPKLDSVDTKHDMLRVDVYDTNGASAAVFNPSDSAGRVSYLGGICFSTRSIVEILPSNSDSFFDNVSFFFQLVGASSVISGTLPLLQMQTPQEFNVMLAATSTPFCIITCCPIASNTLSLEHYNEVQMSSKYGRNLIGHTEPCTCLLSTVNTRDALVINQSISSYSYSFSSLSSAFAKCHCAGRLLLLNDWDALRVIMLELVQLAREVPAQFYAFSGDGQQPISCMFNCCLYGLCDRFQKISASAEIPDLQEFPDVFNVISALTEGITNQARTICASDAEAFRSRYCADSLDEAARREVQMLLSRPYAATDST